MYCMLIIQFTDLSVGNETHVLGHFQNANSQPATQKILHQHPIQWFIFMCTSCPPKVATLIQTNPVCYLHSGSQRTILMNDTLC